MNQAELIDELTGICIQQAEIIKTQAYALEQLGAAADLDGRIYAARNRLRELAEDWNE